jgi:hypothetical protein
MSRKDGDSCRVMMSCQDQAVTEKLFGSREGLASVAVPTYAKKKGGRDRNG